MTGYENLNIDAFYKAKEQLEKQGYKVILPPDIEKPVLEWDGATIAADIKIVTDDVTGIIFLPGWSCSRGARLEAFAGLMKYIKTKDFIFIKFENGDSLRELEPWDVMYSIKRETFHDIELSKRYGLKSA
jgi:hypothetical protein